MVRRTLETNLDLIKRKTDLTISVLCQNSTAQIMNVSQSYVQHSEAEVFGIRGVCNDNTTSQQRRRLIVNGGCQGQSTLSAQESQTDHDDTLNHLVM